MVLPRGIPQNQTIKYPTATDYCYSTEGLGIIPFQNRILRHCDYVEYGPKNDKSYAQRRIGPLSF